MKFKYTILYVKNVAETLNFFRNAFGFKQKMLHESGDYGELDTGPTTLSFSSLALMKSLGKSATPAESDHPTFEIAFETDDVAAAIKRHFRWVQNWFKNLKQCHGVRPLPTFQIQMGF